MPTNPKNAPKPTELVDPHAIQGAMASLRRKAAQNLKVTRELCDAMIAKLDAGEVPRDNHVGWCLAAKDADHDLRVLEQLAHVLACAVPVEFTSSMPTGKDRKPAGAAKGKAPAKKVQANKAEARKSAPAAKKATAKTEPAQEPPAVEQPEPVAPAQPGPVAPTEAEAVQAIEEAIASAGNSRLDIDQLRAAVDAAEASLEAFLATNPDFKKQYPNKKRRAYRKAIAEARARLEEALAAEPAR